MGGQHKYFCYLDVFWSTGCIESHICHIITIERYDSVVNSVGTGVVAMEADVGEIGFHQSWFYIGDADFGVSHVDTESVCNCLDGSLGGTINIASCVSSITGNTSDIDNVSMISTDHSWHDEAGHGEKSLDIGVYHLIPILKVSLVFWFQSTSQTCIIDEYVDILHV